MKSVSSPGCIFSALEGVLALWLGVCQDEFYAARYI
jgi:hypothetical protein